MAARETWSKALRCPRCGREGVVDLSHVEDAADESEAETVIESCPDGFEARPDEDDANIFRFYCLSDGVSADQ